MEWIAAATAPEITQATPTSDVATVPLLIQSQAPWASAVTNLTPGNIVLTVPSQVGAGNGGKVIVSLPTIGAGGKPRFEVDYNGSFLGSFQPRTDNTGIAAVYLGPGLTPSSSNYAFGSDGSTSTLFNAPSGGHNYLGIGGLVYLDVSTSTIVPTPPQIAWINSATSPSIVQSSLASTSAGSGAAGQPMSYTAQAGQAATGGTNAGGAGGSLRFAPGQGGTSGGGQAGTAGNVVVALPLPASGAAESMLTITRNGVFAFGVGPYPGAGTTNNALFLAPNITPNGSNYSLQSDANVTAINSPTSSGTVKVGNGNTGAQGISVSQSAGVGFGLPIAGLSTTPLSFKGQTSPNTVACGTGGTQTISAAQAIIPVFTITGGTLASDCIIDFSTNATTGFFMPTIGTFTAINGHNLSFKNGTTTLSYTVIPTHGMIIVQTGGTNTIALSP